MFRRLNFLIPNAKLAQNMANELINLGVESNNIHTYAEHDLPLDSLRPATENQIRGKTQYLERLFWNGNLILFFILLIAFSASIALGEYLFTIYCSVAMIISFSMGNYYARHLPHTNPGMFKNALSHNELLMMVDLPEEKVGEVEMKIHRHHPAAIEAGSSWTLRGIDI